MPKIVTPQTRRLEAATQLSAADTGLRKLENLPTNAASFSADTIMAEAKRLEAAGCWLRRNASSLASGQ